MTEQVGIPSLDELASAFDAKCCAVSAGIINGLIPDYGTGWTNALLVRLRSVHNRLAAPTVTVMFGGHFSSGKSTLINALIGRSLLPTSDYPETGVPCTITAGAVDRAVLVRGNGTEELSVRSEAIARVVSLIDSAGSYREEVGAASRVDITLAGDALPVGITLIDSPGINDTAAMTERAAVAASSADIVIWIINSRQALSETEQAFLDEQVAGAAEAVVLVVNAFLSADTVPRWGWFLEELAPRVRARIEDALRRDGDQACPAIMFMSARAALGAPCEFGAAAVRGLVTGLRRDSVGVTAARLSRAAAELRVLISELDVRARKEQERNELAKAELERREQDELRHRSEFGKAVTHEVAAVFARHEEWAQRFATETVDQIGSGTLQRDGGHGRALRRRLSEASEQMAAQVLATVSRRAREYGLPQPSAETARRVSSLLAPTDIEITVPNNPVVKTSKTSKGGLGAVIGGVIGSLVVPGAGTLIGATIGGALGAAAGDDGIAASIAKDREGAQANARVAGAAALSALAGKQEAVRRLILQDPCFAQPARPVVSTVNLDAIMTLRRLFQEQRDSWMRLVGTAGDSRSGLSVLRGSLFSLPDHESVYPLDRDDVTHHHVHDPVMPGSQPVVAAPVESLRRLRIGIIGQRPDRRAHRAHAVLVVHVAACGRHRSGRPLNLH